jgi:hypothetical protein
MRTRRVLLCILVVLRPVLTALQDEGDKTFETMHKSKWVTGWKPVQFWKPGWFGFVGCRSCGHRQPMDIRLVGGRFSFAFRVVRQDFTCQIIKI